MHQDEEEEDDTPAFHPFHGHNPWAEPEHVPDPDEGDIAALPGFQVRNTGPGTYRLTGTFRAGAIPRGQQADGDGRMPMPVMPLFADMLNGILGSGRQQEANPTPAEAQQGQQAQNNAGAPQGSQEDPNAPHTRVREGGGPGFRYNITTTTRLFPRDANNPQAPQQPFDDLPNLLNQMFAGMQPPHGHPGNDQDFGPGFPGGGLGPFADLFQLFNPANMRHGDAVYSQEALDRVISQLMEQNQSGRAPGPASAEAIASLPQKTISESDLDDSGKADCSICMESVSLGDKVTELPCHHWFHGECIKAWLGEHDTCPHCRQGIMPKDGAADANQARRPGQAPRHDQMWGQGEGTRESPFMVPDSPTTTTTRPPPGSFPSEDATPQHDGQSEGGSSGGSGGGLFSRMRDAFGGGGGSSNEHR